MRGTKPPAILAGRYVVEAEAGSGGMASVWRATDEVLSRPVAIKVLHPHLGEDPAFVERFHREAVAAARLTHPAIVNVFDTGEQDGTPYIVMEYFEGETLRDLLEREGILALDRAVDLTIQVLAALAFAHENGVVHRDVKPANILVGEGGRAKVTDFGIAKAAYAAAADITTTGSVLGSVPYLSPEQVSGEEVTPRADLYAAGVVMYEMLTGRRPFHAETDLATAMLRLTADPVPPRALRPGIPRGLEAVVLRALARRPEDRFASAGEMAAALSRFRAEPEPRPAAMAEPEEPREEAPSFFRAWMLVPLLVLILGGAAIGLGLLLGRLELGGPLGIQPAEETPPPVATGPPPQRYPVAAVRDHDPFGTGGENADQVQLAVDGDPGTYWKTENYTTLDLGGLKPGVGLLFDLGAVRSVGGFLLETPFPGYTFEIRVGDDPDSLAGEAGIPFEAQARMRRFLDPPLTGRYVLLWITAVVDAGDGNRGTVAEFEVFGPRE